MGKIAFLFSGQGAQYPGMGMDFYTHFPTVAALFDAAEAIRPGTLDTMFHGDDQSLRATEHTQPCLYLADLAPALVLEERGLHADGVAGFSLGEWPALAFADAVSLTDGFSLTVQRGLYMGEAARTLSAGMVAVVKLDNHTVEQVCETFPDVYSVNYNCPGQLVVAGRTDILPAFTQKIREVGGMALPLKVSGGFHSPFMDKAAALFAQELAKVTFRVPRMPVYANRTGMAYREDIVSVLSEQINHPVQWEKTIRQMADNGFDTFIETGVGQVLSKLMPRILPGAKVYTASTPAECQRILEEVVHHE